MAEDDDEIARRVAAFTAGNDPNPGVRFPSGSYRTPDEARERGEAWVARPGEPQDLRDPYHYQTPDDARALGREWASQPAILQGRARHAGFAAGRPGVDPGRAALSALMMTQAPVRQAPAARPGTVAPSVSLQDLMMLLGR